MKKHLLFLAMVLAMNFGARAQSGALTIQNVSTVCTLGVAMQASSVSLGSTGCTDIISNSFFVLPGATFTATDPVNFESIVGWNTLPPSVTTVNTGGGLPPTDWFWGNAIFDYVCPCTTPVFTGVLGPGVIATGCVSTTLSLAGGCWLSNGDWWPVSSGTIALSNITMNFW